MTFLNLHLYQSTISLVISVTTEKKNDIRTKMKKLLHLFVVNQIWQGNFN